MGTRRSSGSAFARALLCLLALVVAASALEAATHEPAQRMLTKRRHHSKPKPSPKGKTTKPSKGSSDMPDALQELYDNIGSRRCYRGVQLDHNPRGCGSRAQCDLAHA